MEKELKKNFGNPILVIFLLFLVYISDFDPLVFRKQCYSKISAWLPVLSNAMVFSFLLTL